MVAWSEDAGQPLQCLAISQRCPADPLRVPEQMPAPDPKHEPVEKDQNGLGMVLTATGMWTIIHRFHRLCQVEHNQRKTAQELVQLAQEQSTSEAHG